MNKVAEYHLKITTVVKEDPRDITLEFDQDRKPHTWAMVDTEIKCKSSQSLAQHLRIIADELDPPTNPFKPQLHPGHKPGCRCIRTTNAEDEKVQELRSAVSKLGGI